MEAWRVAKAIVFLFLGVKIFFLVFAMVAHLFGINGGFFIATTGRPFVLQQGIFVRFVLRFCLTFLGFSRPEFRVFHNVQDIEQVVRAPVSV